MEPRKGLCYAVLLAQLLSLALAVTGITSQSLALRGIAAPTFQSLLNYLLLAASFGAARLAQWRKPLQQAWWRYALLAMMDVEANFLVTKAYQYTSITSVTLLDCFTIPAVMLLSRLLLHARYKLGHLGGAALCISGLTVLVLTDNSSSTGGAAPLLGDALVLLGACCYAACNVTQELLLGDSSVVELLAMQGAFGALLAGMQVALLERSALAHVEWHAPGVVLPFLGFACALYLFYSLVPLVLIWGGATVLNLSLLSSDLWAALARLLLFGGFGGTAPFFMASLVLVSGGIAAFALSGAMKSSRQPLQKQRGEYLRLDSLASSIELASAELDGAGSDDVDDGKEGLLWAERSMKTESGAAVAGLLTAVPASPAGAAAGAHRLMPASAARSAACDEESALPVATSADV